MKGAYYYAGKAIEAATLSGEQAELERFAKWLMDAAMGDEGEEWVRGLIEEYKRERTNETLRVAQAE